MTNRELETRYTQMKLTWKNLVNANVELVDENKYLKEEIERLNKASEIDIEYNKYLQKEIVKLTNSIKEAIDYINNHQLVFELSSKKEISKWCDMFYKELLEILYKGIDKE